MEKRNATFDVLKALMLALACFNHVCGVALFSSGECQYFSQPFGFFNGAEGFVFLAGLLAARTYAHHHLLRRLLRLYGVHVALCALAVSLDKWDLFTFLRLVTFAHTAPYLDVIPLYLAFTLITPCLGWCFARGWGKAALAVSATIWLGCQWQTLRAPADFYFNLLAWQFLFVIGFACQRWNARGSLWAIGGAAIFAGLRWLPALAHFTGGREHLAPWGLVDFLCAAAALEAVLRRYPLPPKSRAVAALGVIGRNSLWVFAFNSAARSVLQAWALPVQGHWRGLALGAVLALAHVGVAYLTDRQRVRKVTTFALLGGVALLPLLYLPGFGLAYRDARWIALWALGVCTALALLRDLAARRPFAVSVWQIAVFALALWQLTTFARAANLGLAWSALATTLALAAIAVYLGRDPIEPKRLIAFLLPAIAIVTALVELRVYTGFRLVDEGAGLGALIGERNSTAAWLALCYPIALLAESQSRLKRVAWWGLGIAILNAILASRTRAAWWMLIAYAIAFALSGRKRWGRAGVKMAAQVVVALAILLTLPNHLRWNSPHPYRASLETLASPHYGNGRVALWRAGWKLARHHWWGGVGAGNYPALARESLATSGEDPMKFGFLRPDLPLFQDFLQEATETGFPGALIFLFIAGLAPLCLAWRALRVEDDPKLVALALGAAALVGNALLDSPLHRPETLFLFVVFFATVARRFSPPRLELGYFRRPALVACASLAVLLAITTLRFGSSLALRDAPRAVARAWSWWRWDSAWNESTLQTFLRAGSDDLAENFVSARQHDWPRDPTTSLITAMWEEHRDHHARAQLALEEASLQLPNGRPVPGVQERFRRFLGSRGIASQSPVIVLMYHQFTTEPKGDQYLMPVVVFEKELSYLKEQGYESILSEDYRRALEGQGTLPPKSVMLTFDDWTPDQFELARPRLEKFGFHGVFFVVAEKAQSDTERRKLRALVAAGHEVGSHGEHHYFLTQSPCDADWKCCHEKKPCRTEQVHSELAGSKQTLDRIVGQPVTSFAWPGGFFDGRTIEAGKNAGYRTLFAVEDATMEDGFATNRPGVTTGPERIYRTEIDGRCPIDAFRKALSDGRCCVVSDRKFYRFCLPQTP